MQKIIITIMTSCALMLVGCGTTSTTKTTSYNADGSIASVVETTSDASDLSAYLASGDGNATTLSADVNKFNVGYSGWGINWLSIAGVRVKAPVNPTGSNSKEALDATADVISAKKTTIQTGDVGVNTDAAKTAESAK